MRSRYDDGKVSELSTAMSGTTGERWAVCALDSVSIASRIEFLDEAGTVLDARDAKDPRTAPNLE